MQSYISPCSPLSTPSSLVLSKLGCKPSKAQREKINLVLIMVLQERMRNTKMAKGEGVVPYLTRLTQIRDELGVVGSKTDDEELVRIAHNGFSKPWDTFVKVLWLGRSSLIGRNYVMTLCRRRPA